MTIQFVNSKNQPWNWEDHILEEYFVKLKNVGYFSGEITGDGRVESHNSGCIYSLDNIEYLIDPKEPNNIIKPAPAPVGGTWVDAYGNEHAVFGGLPPYLFFSKEEGFFLGYFSSRDSIVREDNKQTYKLDSGNIEKCLPACSRYPQWFYYKQLKG